MCAEREMFCVTIETGGMMEMSWQLQSSRSPPVPVSLTEGLGPNGLVYATWYWYKRVAGGVANGYRMFKCPLNNCSLWWK